MKLDLFPRLLRSIVVAVLLAGCAPSPGDLFEKMIATNDYEELLSLSGQAMDLGKDSIPIFLAILSREVPEERRSSVFEIAKTDVAMARLNDLAKRGVFSVHAIPYLLRDMERPPGPVKGSLVAAETLKLITGLDVGYSEQFAADYTDADELRWKQMLATWRAWYEQEVANEQSRRLSQIALTALSVGWVPSPEYLFERMMATNDVQEIWFLYSAATDLGKDSIPIFLTILSRDVRQDHRLSIVKLTKTGQSIQGLSDLARQGIYNIHSIPILLRHMDEDLVRLDISLGTAEALELITGLDVGYDEQFVADYTEADEPRRKQMLAKWRSWYEEAVAKERHSELHDRNSISLGAA